ncbi:MAG: DNA polymerase III subunit gamma/tau [Patescibacteria group bacterium]
MTQVLYQKYRPQSFLEVLGQDHIKTVLMNELKAGNVPHAFLFCGPRGIGKTTLARLIAKSLNCEQLKEGEPCNQCEACKSILAGKALDVIEIDAASHTGVDNVRENIIDNSRVAPSHFKNKVFIIDEVHMLSISAFNALLKTLEEPPANTYFILATTEVHKVPETIISRCQRFDFKKVSPKEIVKKLEKIVIEEGVKVDIEVLNRIVNVCDGAIRDAESLLSQVLSLEEDQITLDIAELVLPRSDINLAIGLFILLAEKNIKEGISKINELIDQGVDLNNFNTRLIELLRKIILYKVDPKLENLDYLALDEAHIKKLLEIIESISLNELMRITNIFIGKTEELKSADIIQLPLEMAVIEICNQEQPITTNIQNDINNKKEVKEEKEVKADNPVNIQTPPLYTPQKKVVTQTPETDFKKKAVKCEKLDEIQKNWPKIIKAIREKNHSLALTIQLSHLICIEGDVLTLGLKYKFHTDRICEAENLEIIESIFEEKLGRKVKVKCILGDEYDINEDVVKTAKSDNIENPSDEEVQNVWDLAKNTFGADIAKSS